MLGWIRNLFKKKQPKAGCCGGHCHDLPVLNEHGDAEDEFVARMVNQAFHTGDIVIGHRDDNGVTSMKSIKRKKK